MLTVKQENYIQNIVKGMSQREAYKKAYNAKYQDDAIDNKASKLFNKAEVQTRYRQLMKRIEDKSIMTAEERQVWLSKVIKADIKVTSESDGEHKEYDPYMSDRLKAVDLLNKMSGQYITKVEADVNTDVNINIELSDE